MAEYINKDDLLQAYNEIRPYLATKVAEFTEILENFPAADVQPFKWVRCEESLPVYDGLVLVADRDNNIRLGVFTDMGWRSQYGNAMLLRPKAWAKIPDLPETIKG